MVDAFENAYRSKIYDYDYDRTYRKLNLQKVDTYLTWAATAATKMEDHPH